MAAAWQSLEKSEELRIYLVKARELNRHLRELNVAAAGLAHETRNPLNLVRGQAQIISRDHSISPEVRKQSLSIVEEVDRVTNRLSEFINYSKPALPRPVPVKLPVVVQDVERTLSADIQDKSIHFRISGPDLVVEADEGLLRQVLFNLVLNAVQAVEEGGEIEVIMESSVSGEASISVKDNGCGIAPEDRENVYRPYFTTHETGTGLGLAVVRRIVQAHSWEVEHKPAGEKGTIFILSKLKIIRTTDLSGEVRRTKTE
jgi:signal transduction histidine kinase